MMRKNRNYIFGGVLLLIQFLEVLNITKFFDMTSFSRNTLFILFAFLYLKEGVYEFKTHLIWDEIKIHIRCWLEFMIITTIMSLNSGEGQLIKNYTAGTIYFLFNLLFINFFRKSLYNKLKKNLIIVGTGKHAAEITRIIKENSFTLYNILGCLEVDKDRIMDYQSEIEKYAENNEIDEVIIALPDVSDKELGNLIDKIEDKVGKIKFIPKINRMYTLNPEIQDYDGMMLVAVPNKRLSRKRKIFKRLIDIAGAVVGVTILAPLYLVFGRKIKADGGEALFTHNRIGKDLKNFRMYKFRSMYVDAEVRLQKMLEEDEALKEEFYKNFKLKNDPRVTPVGEFLRNTSLDEFPQFLNVLRGDMSLVGPRPVVQKEIDMYYGEENGKKVFQEKPGITGMWQANGRSDVENYEERIELDLYYIRNWSIWLDIVILLKTIKSVMGKKGAY